MDNVSGVLIRFKDQFLTFTNVPGIKIGVIDIIEILIISVLFYHILLWIKTTRAWNLFKGLIIILLFVLVAALFQMDTILWLAEKLFNIGLVALVVIFQPELRNALENIGGKTFLGDFFSTGRGEIEKFSDRTIDELVRAFRLDALVSDSRSSAFHSACWSGYPGVGAPLEDGATLWFYGARWAKDWLPALVQGYQNVCRLMDRQDEPPAALNYPTR